MNTDANDKTLLLIGASRGIGLAMAEEFAKRGWHVVGTVRGFARTQLHEIAVRLAGRIEIETVDINMPDEVSALRARLAARRFDMRTSAEKSSRTMNCSTRLPRISSGVQPTIRSLEGET